MLSEDLSGADSTVEDEERIDRQLESMEAEVLLEKEGVLPPLESEGALPSKTSKTESSDEKRIDELLADLEKEAREERAREKES